MNNLTCILSQLEQGDPQAPEQLLPLVYDELRKLAAQRLARESPGQALQATALVHEAYVRLVGSETPSWSSRGHFFSAAAESVRRILIENARRKRAGKHGGDFERDVVSQDGERDCGGLVCPFCTDVRFRFGSGFSKSVSDRYSQQMVADRHVAGRRIRLGRDSPRSWQP